MSDDSNQIILFQKKYLTKLLSFTVLQYGLTWEKEAINNLIDKAICEADKKGAKVVSLGLLNQVCHLFSYSRSTTRKYMSFEWKLHVYVLPF